MNKIDKFIELLNSRKIAKKIDRLYEDDKRILFKKVRNQRLYEACLKSAILSDYLMKTEDIVEDTIVKRLEDGSIFDEYTNVPYIMNAFVSKVGDPIKRLDKSYIDELLYFEEDDAFPNLDDRENEIIKVIKDEMDMVTFDEFINGLCKKEKESDNSAITIDELKKISYVKMIPGIINYIHLLYDDFGDNEDDIGCAYAEIKENYLKPFAFHTTYNRPTRTILFDDETILYYSEGDFRFLPYTFSDIVYLVKLGMIDIYRNGPNEDEEDIALRDLANNEELSEIPIEDMNELLFEHLAIFALSDIYDIFEAVDFQYSRKMIEDSKKELEKYRDLTLRYKL